MFECIYGVCKNSGISCDCDDGYIGLFCFERLVIMIKIIEEEKDEKDMRDVCFVDYLF